MAATEFCQKPTAARYANKQQLTFLDMPGESGEKPELEVGLGG